MQVERLCEELQNMLMVGIAESPHHAVCLLLSKSTVRKLDHDARECLWNERQGCCMKERRRGHQNTMQSLLGRTMGSDTLALATLLGPLSGIGLGPTSSCADAHFVARVKATEHLVNETLGFMAQKGIWNVAMENKHV